MNLFLLWFWHLFIKRRYKARLVAVTELLQGMSCGLYTALLIQSKFVTGFYTQTLTCIRQQVGTVAHFPGADPGTSLHLSFPVLRLPSLPLITPHPVCPFFSDLPLSFHAIFLRSFSVPCLKLEQVQRVSGQ